MEKTIIFVLDRSPFGTIWNLEGLRLASAVVSLDMEVKLLLIDDGVFVAVEGHQPDLIMRSPIDMLVQMILMISETAEVLVVQESLQERGLSDEDLELEFEPKIISLETAAQTISSAFTTIVI
ncbi:MAG: DsrE family protein [Candidatus Hodarchaeota archaeon]